jgi:hypothetical protein
MLAFGLTIFWGAFLLFLVQPLIARFILPWFGGGPAVWTTCMLFFQLLLLGGYAYAHFLIKTFRTRHQVLAHLILVFLALAFLPIVPNEALKPIDGSAPTLHILILLLSCLGLPYFVLSATGPLFQAWFAQTHPGVSPYRLYALSNIGSLCALFFYPFVLEPRVGRHEQAVLWSFGLGGFALLAAWCAKKIWQSGRDLPIVTAKANETAPSEAPSFFTRLQWFLLPACAVVLLLAMTNKICQDIAVIPFLWILPLGLYLLSFIITFDSPRWYARWFWLPLLALCLGMSTWLLMGYHTGVTDYWFDPLPWLFNRAKEVSLFNELGLHLATLFVGCMVCHGEVYRLRPAPDRLTSFYLSLSAGGALGGLFVAVLAPLIFVNYFELHVGLILLAVLTMVILFRDPASPLYAGRRRWAWVTLGLILPAFVASMAFDINETVRNSVKLSRNFYGALKVTEHYMQDSLSHQLVLQHGGTTHGLQFLAPERRRLAATYYTPTSGVGRILRTDRPNGGRRVAVVGLGTGSLSSWGRPGDTFCFYEINDDIVNLARHTFTFLQDSQADVKIKMGDARLTLEREPDQEYDLMVLDAFSSDAIPVHLLTKEALVTYLRHLQPNGTLAVHISNRSLNLEPVVLKLAAFYGLNYAIVRDEEPDSLEDSNNNPGVYASDWVLLSRNDSLLKQSLIHDVASKPRPNPTQHPLKLWTDDQSDLLSILIVDPDSFLSWLKEH